MEKYLTQLLAIQKQVNGLVEEIQATMLREKIGSGPPVEMPKKRGRPPKAAVESSEEAVEKPKRILSDEHKQKMKEGRERAKAARDAEKAAASLAASETESVVDSIPEVVEEAPPAPVAPVEEKPKKRVITRKIVPKVAPVEEKPSDEKPSEGEIYKYMFELQESGVCNMLASGQYLRKHFKSMTSKEAEDIVLNYMSNYGDLYAKYGPNE
jgi:hypothetical protein